MPIDPISWTAVLTWISSALLAVTAFFLVRLFKNHDANLAQNSEVLKLIKDELTDHKVKLAVHGERLDRQKERIGTLEDRERP